MYMFLYASCHRCNRVFGSNPDLVPAVRDSQGIKQPICASCVRSMQNLQRCLIRDGRTDVEVWPDPLPGAYEPQQVMDGD